ncbi:hypothetical protein BT69DRAFT_1278659 [Atractiella rhizophila]|nr:hypothetical protein BT69DRAFT_1278659 [Atractiella rhizophila]
MECRIRDDFSRKERINKLSHEIHPLTVPSSLAMKGLTNYVLAFLNLTASLVLPSFNIHPLRYPHNHRSEASIIAI